MYKFTVFIPYYNRETTIIRLLDSLENQTFKDFECIIVDDGSSDNFLTENINNIKNTYSFHIRYFFVNNGGKHRARNLALNNANSEFFFTIDSDDYLLENCLKLLDNSWFEIDKNERENFAGVEALLAKVNNKEEAIGGLFPKNQYISDHLTTRFFDDIGGDKTRFIRTEVFKQYLFPEISGENFITESIVWNKIGLKYKMLYINEVVAIVDYQTNGLTANGPNIRIKNPNGSRLYYKEFINLISKNCKKIKFRYKLKNHTNYVRYSLHCKLKLKNIISDIDKKNYLILTLIFGYIMYLKDKKTVKSV